ncbi:MAG: M48 family metalloprotease, partial [Patescibacteria group bacterium]|nr:M48 family metalloprotease [Patescibacteria group bacterium]
MYSNIAANKRKTVIIMTVFMAFIAALIYAFSYVYAGKSTGVFYGGIIGAAIYTLITYYAGSKMALAVNGAKEIGRNDDPRLWRMVENLSITNGMPMPKVYIMEDPSPNAFATGRDPKHAAVCATTGILQILNDTELEGVLAHELGHVKNYDIRVSMVAFALTAVISFLADIMLRMTFFSNDDEGNNSPLALVFGIAAAILAPLVATMIQLAISRQREYLADATGALTTRYPEGLASALEKIGQANIPAKRQSSATAHLFFVNPL